MALCFIGELLSIYLEYLVIFSRPTARSKSSVCRRTSVASPRPRPLTGRRTPHQPGNYKTRFAVSDRSSICHIHVNALLKMHRTDPNSPLTAKPKSPVDRSRCASGYSKCGDSEGDGRWCWLSKCPDVRRPCTIICQKKWSCAGDTGCREIVECSQGCKEDAKVF